jgi:hypothetical protein
MEVAIELWFQHGDPVAIHTLTAAARRIVLDLCVHRKLPLGLFDTTFVKSGLEKEYKRQLRKAETFFKHANDDPNDKLSFDPNFTETYLMDAIESYHHLRGTITTWMVIFRVRFFLFHPEVFRTDLFPILKESDRIKLQGVGRAHFPEEFLRLCGELAKQGVNPGHADSCE